MRPEPMQVLEVAVFEESMVESLAVSVPTTKRWTVAASLITQISIAAVLAALPLLYPEMLGSRVVAPLVFTPPPPRVPLPVLESRSMTDASAQSTTIPTIEHLANPVFLRNDKSTSEDTPPVSNAGINMGDAMPSALTDQPSGGSVRVVPVQAPPRSVRVSQLSAGMLLTPIRPVYPSIARAAGVSGQVVVSAVISGTGTIESLEVVSGPELLRRAALDAIRAARYRPFLLNGQPVEVQTTITVTFRMGQ
jgi:protein TonB